MASPARRSGIFAWTARHKRHPVHGVQFHPESIASEHGHRVLRNFLDIAAEWRATNRAQPALA
jgi:anthranilate synthase component 2